MRLRVRAGLLAMPASDSAHREAVPCLARFAKEAPPARYRADIARARDRVREIEES